MLVVGRKQKNTKLLLLLMLGDIFYPIQRSKQKLEHLEISNLQDGLDFGLIDACHPALTKPFIKNIISELLSSAVQDNKKQFSFQ